jgi:alpha-galactosidase
MSKKIVFFFLFFPFGVFAQKFEGLALTPPMGWNSWNTFQTNISEQLVKEMADVMVASGMRDAGYNFLVLDDGWMAMERDPKTGDLIADPKKFPNGMKAVADYVHSKGLKFGLYNCAGTKTCAGYPGTRGYEYQDARFYASVGCDYLKFDWCNTEGINAKEAYNTMSKALRAAGRPIVFSLCEWGSNKPWEWAQNVGQLWRTTGDIYAQFDSVHSFGNWKALGVMTIVDMQTNLRKYAGPGHWNDPDMLEVGNGLSPEENRAHFSIWAMLAAPLMAGNDLRKMDAQSRETLTNKQVIAIDQDSLGIQGFRYAVKDSMETWLRPLNHGDWAVCIINRGSKPRRATFSWKEPLLDTLSGRSLSGAYEIVDLWSKPGSAKKGTEYSGEIRPHDAVLLRLRKTNGK